MRIVQHWSAGWNQGHYLPNPDGTMHGGTLEEARDHLLADVENELNSIEDMHGDVREQFLRVWSALRDLDMATLTVDAERARGNNGNWEAWAHGWQYWIMPCFTIDCDQVEDTEGMED